MGEMTSTVSCQITFPRLSGAVAELPDFIDRAQHGVEVIGEEGASRGFGRRTGFGAVDLGRHRNPRIEEVAEKGVIVPPLPSFDVYGMFHKVWR